MKRYACQYAIVRFLPYVETGEFANVGVVLACPATGYLDARLLPTKNIGRISSFFDQLDKRIFRDVIDHFRDELKRVRFLTQQRHGSDVETRQLFAGLTRAREALLRFSETRAILAEAPDATLSTLYCRFVERDFANKTYHEHLLERGVREVLRKANLREYFSADDVGTPELHVHFPFVNKQGGKPKLAIKPLDLDKDEANKVYDLGGHWVERLRRLGKHGLLPDETLLTVRLPQTRAGAIERAADEIVRDMRDQGIQVVSTEDAAAITRFAAAAKTQ